MAVSVLGVGGEGTQGGASEDSVKDPQVHLAPEAWSEPETVTSVEEAVARARTAVLIADDAPGGPFRFGRYL